MVRGGRLIGLVLVAALAGSALAQGEVLVRATLDGRPADVKVVVRQGEKTLGVHYSPAAAPGLVRIPLPPGTYTLVVDRGAGFTRGAVLREVTVEAGRAVELEVALPTGFSPRAWGYYGGDPHAHSSASFDGKTPPEELVAVQLAADLDLGFLTDHNTGDGHAPYAAAAANRGFPVVLGIEITAFRWHWNAFPVQAYVPQIPPMVWMGVGSPAPTFAEARAQGARFVQANHPYWSGAPYFEALGKPFFDPGFELVEIANGPFEDDDARAVEQMFKFWNEGRRYVAVGASDAHDWKDPADPYGRPRTYVHVEGEFTVEKWLDALGRGRAFVTYGPLVNLTAQGAARPGDTVALKPGEELRLRAELVVAPRDGPRGLSLLQVIRNGAVVREFALDGKPEATITFTDRPTTSGWYIVRVVATDGDGAWTNPIWVEVK
ncbi:MAG: CehA/McbA family metallohydrolase [Candidatus Bipolaricaulota bacterium]|nr:CehA/McbA family metallohydrolase [Candidatus Bipolaricaulota bacterium]